MAPAAREHGLPAGAAAVVGAAVQQVGGRATAALPFVLDVAGVPRLPRITGDPPFTVKGPSKGKPGLNREEFVRQLTGQQDGLNRLTVAEFIANRDAYLQRAKTKPDGRDPKGNAAQQLARDKAFSEKVLELRRQDKFLTKEEAKMQATQWLSTQTALHDPDQIAGGYGHLVTGTGDARVNSAIGGFWPSRIKGIDQQVRIHAAAMTPEQQATTFLDIVLPIA